MGNFCLSHEIEQTEQIWFVFFINRICEERGTSIRLLFPETDPLFSSHLQLKIFKKFLYFTEGKIRMYKTVLYSFADDPYKVIILRSYQHNSLFSFCE